MARGSSYQGHPIPILPWVFPRAVTALSEHQWSGQERQRFLSPPSHPRSARAGQGNRKGGLTDGPTSPAASAGRGPMETSF